MADFIGTKDDDGLIGSLFSDTISGSFGDDLLVGLNGDDQLDGGNGRDVLIGGIGDDTMFGGDGNDKIVMTAGDDIVFGGAGNDKYFVNGFAGDWSLITDTSGIDTLNFFGGITGAKIDLSPGAVSTVDGRFIEISGLDDTERPLELVLLQDLSGSFGDDLTTVNGLVDDLITSVTGLASDVRLGLTSFIDKPISPFGSTSDYEYQTDLGLTGDTDVWKTAVTGLSVRSGGDGPEAQMTGLLQTALRTAEVGWSANSLKIVVLTTDAVPHFSGDNPGTANDGDNVTDGPADNGTGEDYPSIAQVKDALLAAGIIPVFAVTAGVVSDYQALVDDFGFGSVVTLSSDSSDIIAAFEDGIASAADSVIEHAIGTMFDDVILGNNARNILKGRAGDDELRGGRGYDVLEGEKGQDVMFGGVGNDQLTGGRGRDKLIGGSGEDNFIFKVGIAAQGLDVIRDFEDDVDVITLQKDVAMSFVDITTTQVGADTVLNHAGIDFAVLRGVDAIDIDATDFVFEII